MKKLTALITALAFSSAVVAGPVEKTALTSQDAVKLAHKQEQSKKVLEVQAGAWADDYGIVIVAAILSVAALAIGIVALADD